MGLEAMNGDISLGGNCQVFPFKKLLAEEVLFPRKGVGFPLLARELSGIYRFKVLSLVPICPNVFKPCLTSHSSPASALTLRSEPQQVYALIGEITLHPLPLSCINPAITKDPSKLSLVPYVYS